MLFGRMHFTNINKCKQRDENSINHIDAIQVQYNILLLTNSHRTSNTNAKNTKEQEPNEQPFNYMVSRRVMNRKSVNDLTLFYSEKKIILCAIAR